MKSIKLSYIVVGILTIFSTFVSNIYAQSLTPQIPPIGQFGTLEELISALFGLIRPLFILTFIGMMLYAAYVWLTSQGDEGKIGKARNIIVASIIGLSIAVFAPAIAGIVASFLGVETLNLFSLN